MNASQAKYPQLRFKGFTDPWEQRKLGDIVVFLNGRAYKQAELLDSGKYPVLRVGNFNTNDKWYYSDLELPAKNYADKGDLLYTWATAFGPHIWKGPKVIYHYHIWKVETTSDISKNFAVHLLDADQAQMTNSLNGSTMVHITKGTMENKIVTIPGISEQRNMARLLDQLDCTIALHQRKLDLLKEQKKGYLQKMFPKNGEKVPELRFAGFADAWEQRKLGNELTLLKDGTHGTHQNVLEGPFLLSAKNIKNGKIIIDEITDRKISVEEYNSIHKNFSLEKGDVLLTIVGSIGETAIIENPIGITFQRSVAYLRPSHTILSQFLFTTINGQKFQMELRKRQVVSAQPGIYLGDLSIIPISIPSVAEQEKIGSFFKQLDETIALHQRKLDLLKEQKKGFLQKMFV
ncbi:restriction endonuclease subunit S [Companilactobacillus zhachilii]|uniref:restriction endonuclease subunit S n=1 Tax=Companilactobacillus zhachilii TaxID=2304606 RepID=UPI0019221EDC|nr:restriction endonuclease subunit S [Companilactobacillus zhachilii]MBL3530376.1 restriction endonuclease subunit S [Companilactobacillus zhachilii]